MKTVKTLILYVASLSLLSSPFASGAEPKTDLFEKHLKVSVEEYFAGNHELASLSLFRAVDLIHRRMIYGEFQADKASLRAINRLEKLASGLHDNPAYSRAVLEKKLSAAARPLLKKDLSGIFRDTEKLLGSR